MHDISLEILLKQFYKLGEIREIIEEWGEIPYQKFLDDKRKCVLLEPR